MTPSNCHSINNNNNNNEENGSNNHQYHKTNSPEQWYQHLLCFHNEWLKKIMNNNELIDQPWSFYYYYYSLFYFFFFFFFEFDLPLINRLFSRYPSWMTAIMWIGGVHRERWLTSAITFNVIVSCRCPSVSSITTTTTSTININIIIRYVRDWQYFFLNVSIHLNIVNVRNQIKRTKMWKKID